MNLSVFYIFLLFTCGWLFDQRWFILRYLVKSHKSLRFCEKTYPTTLLSAPPKAHKEWEQMSINCLKAKYVHYRICQISHYFRSNKKYFILQKAQNKKFSVLENIEENLSIQEKKIILFHMYFSVKIIATKICWHIFFLESSKLYKKNISFFSQFPYILLWIVMKKHKKKIICEKDNWSGRI